MTVLHSMPQEMTVQSVAPARQYDAWHVHVVDLCLVYAVLSNQGHCDARGPCMAAHRWGLGEFAKSFQSHKQQRETVYFTEIPHCGMHLMSQRKLQDMV